MSIEYFFMPIGLRNASATIQTLMYKMCHDAFGAFMAIYPMLKNPGFELFIKMDTFSYLNASQV